MKIAIAALIGAVLLSFALIAVYMYNGVPAELAIGGPVAGLMVGLLFASIMEEVE